jgi:hypothetical protein
MLSANHVKYDAHPMVARIRWAIRPNGLARHIYTAARVRAEGWAIEAF